MLTSTTRDARATRRPHLWKRLILPIFAVAWLASAVWQSHKPLPPGLHVDSAWTDIDPDELTFIADVTSADAYGRPVVSQAIFDQVLGTIAAARRFIVLDYHLFNSEEMAGTPAAPAAIAPRPIARELRDALVEQRRSVPNLEVLFITDPVNEHYGAAPSADLASLRAAGVEVAVVDLDRLRDANLIYSGLWRLAASWWSGDGRRHTEAASQDQPADPAGGLPNPLDESDARLPLRAWLRSINFKSDHRNVVIADDGHGGLTSIVGSASPQDASTDHSNAAMRVQGPAMLPLLESELAIARFSGWHGTLTWPASAAAGALVATDGAAPPARIRVLTEGGIRAELLRRLAATGSGDEIEIAVLYLSDRDVVEALLAAQRRGAVVRLILDPNESAYGHAKTGIPNQPVASDLVAASDGAIHVRWYRTHGERFHAKLVMIRDDRRLWATLGSASLTRRCLDDFNLEANIAVDLDRGGPLAGQMLAYFDTLWVNHAPLGIEYTADFGFYADPSQGRYWLYRLLEGTGLGTF